MPPKITPKNLHYDDTLPPFLARLRAHESSLDSRQEFTVARPKKNRTAEEEAEDEPVYFNEESGETLTKGEWEERENGKDADGEKGEGQGDAKEGGKEEGKEEIEGEKEKLATIGGNRKRKVGRVIGGDGEEEEDSKKDFKPVVNKTGGKVEGKKVGGGEKGKNEKKKKGKKIKLSFGDDD